MSTGVSASRQSATKVARAVSATVVPAARNIPVEQQFGFDQEGVEVVTRNGVIDAGDDRQRFDHVVAVKREQGIDRGRIARLDRRGRIARHEQLGAEILQHDEALIEIGGVDFRRGKSAFAQTFGQGDERFHVFRKMRDGAVGLAVAHGRAVGPRRRIHQDRGSPVQGEPLVGARGGIALHALALRIRKAGLFEKAAQRREAFDARCEAAIAGHARVAHLEALLRHQGERDVEAIGRQESRRAVGPFEQHHGVFRQIVETELRKLARSRQPVEIGMDQRKARQIVILHQREGRARNGDDGVFREIADQRARERRLAGAEIARQRDEIAGLERIGDVGREPRRRLLVVQRDGKARSAGCHRKHDVTWS